jgi:hypothetical protein
MDNAAKFVVDVDAVVAVTHIGDIEAAGFAEIAFGEVMGGYLVPFAAFADEKMMGGVEAVFGKSMGVDFAGGVGLCFPAAAGGQQESQQKAQEGEALFHGKTPCFVI